MVALGRGRPRFVGRMGWLKPEEHLIEDPDFLGKVRPTTPPKYKCVVTALGERVQGVRVDGEALADTRVLLDDSFMLSPVLERQGVPLMVKRLDGEVAAADMDVAGRTFVHKLMTCPELGLPVLWNDGAAPMPPLLVARGDGVPLAASDWSRLRAYHDAMELEGHPNFAKRLRDWSSSQQPCATRYTAGGPPPLRLAFAVGVTVVAHGLNRAELNGMEGEPTTAHAFLLHALATRWPCLGLARHSLLPRALTGVVSKHDARKQRVGVEYPPPHGLLSLPRDKLRMVRGIGASATAAAKVHGEHDGGTGQDHGPSNTS